MGISRLTTSVLGPTDLLTPDPPSVGSISRGLRDLGSFTRCWVHLGIVLNYCQYGVLYLGSHYYTGPYINFPRFGNSNLGKLSFL